MGLFSKIKNMFKDTKNEEKEEIQEKTVTVEKSKVEKEKFEDKKKEEKQVGDNIVDKVVEKEKDVKIYEKGLTKSRQGFVSKLVSLTSKYEKITSDYFDELEEILIMADIGVNTVMSFMDRLKERAKSENITDPSELKEVMVFRIFNWCFWKCG